MPFLVFFSSVSPLGHSNITGTLALLSFKRNVDICLKKPLCEETRILHGLVWKTTFLVTDSNKHPRNFSALFLTSGSPSPPSGTNSYRFTSFLLYPDFSAAATNSLWGRKSRMPKVLSRSSLLA